MTITEMLEMRDRNHHQFNRYVIEDANQWDARMRELQRLAPAFNRELLNSVKAEMEAYYQRQSDTSGEDREAVLPTDLDN